ncbi:decarbamoylnovobiocin carbamoyltransferase [Roseovarius mucosus]|uniref:Decarbamoylnovobiocin carbamoyltransferase n=1 Tax=Roseovarius mucosus TaxID=215743 RepID=A0A1V0RPB4_9RHOB|nr:carbamoyltransferase N-terminal domain-containing protein [Roseovarius mucosus]ARE83475.1 decarbamoylnovobiocin carbamoyltransferase [Roseovarius mucosus]
MTAPRYTLGISSHFHDSAAALVQGTHILAAAQEERFTRRKADWQFPMNAITYCLSQLPEGASLDRVAYYEDPGLKLRRILQTAQTRLPTGARLWPRMVETLRSLAEELPMQLRKIAEDTDRIVFVPHHRSHAASAFYPAPFAEAAVLVLDGVGEYSTTTLWSGKATGLKAEAEISFPHSLGLFYSAFTQYCGFKVNSGEYKLMGLAPFGTPEFRQKILDELIELQPDGSFALNMAYFDFDRGLSTTSPLFEMLFGQPQRKESDPMTQVHMNLAASAQAVLEEAVLALAKTALDRAQSMNLCLAGGVALNCVANSRLIRDLPGLRNLWIQPASGDAGGALGAALEVARDDAATEAQPIPNDTMAGGFLGPQFTDADICAPLETAGLVYQQLPDPATYADTVARALAEGQIVGHFHGRMEFGPRALGNRSILADPRGKDTLSRVNKSIKFREDWRPFAPIVLADQAPLYFEDPTDSPYMLLVAQLRPEFCGKTTLSDARGRGLHSPMQLQNAVVSDFAAVTHVDFSARLQTVTPGIGTRAGAILAAFHAMTGCPMLLNTSFNVRGEPIICSPKDAIDCFLNTHLDLLAIGGVIVRKSAQPDWVHKKIGRMHFAAD